MRITNIEDLSGTIKRQATIINALKDKIEKVSDYIEKTVQLKDKIHRRNMLINDLRAEIAITNDRLERIKKKASKYDKDFSLPIEHSVYCRLFND